MSNQENVNFDAVNDDTEFVESVASGEGVVGSFTDEMVEAVAKRDDAEKIRRDAMRLIAGESGILPKIILPGSVASMTLSLAVANQLIKGTDRYHQLQSEIAIAEKKRGKPFNDAGLAACRRIFANSIRMEILLREHSEECTLEKYTKRQQMVQAVNSSPWAGKPVVFIPRRPRTLLTYNS